MKRIFLVYFSFVIFSTFSSWFCFIRFETKMKTFSCTNPKGSVCFVVCNFVPFRIKPMQSIFCKANIWHELTQFAICLNGIYLKIIILAFTKLYNNHKRKSLQWIRDIQKSSWNTVYFKNFEKFKLPLCFKMYLRWIAFLKLNIFSKWIFFIEKDRRKKPVQMKMKTQRIETNTEEKSSFEWR